MNIRTVMNTAGISLFVFFSVTCKLPTDIDTHYLCFHTIIKHFDYTYGFKDVMSVREAIWRWLTFCTDDDKSAMGPNLLQKQRKFPIYVREYEETGYVDEVVLWVLLGVMREPIAILLKGEFWITMVEEDIGDVQMFVCLWRGRAFHSYLPHDRWGDAR